jgi:hypothetical protein
MLQLLDESLESFLRAEVPLGREEVDVAFEIPDPDWGSGLTKPTVNLYLWDVRRSASQNEAGKVLGERNGQKVWTDPLPRIAFRYMITAWANEVRDEHQLLGAVLTALLPSATLPTEHLQGSLARLRPTPMMYISGHEASDLTDFWSTMEGKLKPGLDLMVTATVDAAVVKEAGPPTEGFELRFGDRQGSGDMASTRTLTYGRVLDPAGVGAVVLGPRGSATVDPDGTFRVQAKPGDELIIEMADAEKRVRVPDSGGEVVVE